MDKFSEIIGEEQRRYTRAALIAVVLVEGGAVMGVMTDRLDQQAFAGMLVTAGLILGFGLLMSLIFRVLGEIRAMALELEEREAETVSKLIEEGIRADRAESTAEVLIEANRRIRSAKVDRIGYDCDLPEPTIH